MVERLARPEPVPSDTPDAAVRVVFALAQGLREQAEDAAVSRLLERVAASGDTSLRDALVLLGARAAIAAAARMRP